MKIFLDTADIDEIRIAARWGVLDGVTTNPSLYAKVGGSYEDILKEICRLTSGPVSAEVVAEDVEGMLREGRAFAKLARNIVVKVPMSEEGLEAISRFAEEGIKTNCTLIFSANQGLLAAKAGASLLSPFVGRLDDINQDGMTCVRELVDIVEIHDLEAEVLAASIRHPLHVTQAALVGSHIATLPFKILQQMVHHPLTDKGIVTFRQDWEKARAAAAAKSDGTAAKSAAASSGATPVSRGNGAKAGAATAPAARNGATRGSTGSAASRAKSGGAAKSGGSAGRSGGKSGPGSRSKSS
jgi:transaldolase